MAREMDRQRQRVPRFYDDFLTLIRTEPTECFTDTEKHHFVAMIVAKLEDAAVTQETFAKWQMEVKAGFCRNNFMYLRIQTIEKLDAASGNTSSILIDPRALLDVIRMMGRTIEFQGSQITIMSERIQRMERRLEASTRSVASEQIQNDNTSIRSALTYSTLMAADSSDAQKSLESLFYRWFYHDAPECYKRETQKTDKVRKQYNRHKVVVGYLLRFLTNYPPVKPESAADVLKWGETITEMANKAVEVAVSKANNCSLTVSAFLKLMKDKQDELESFKLPVGDHPHAEIFSSSKDNKKN
jgi:hypothetical protein